MIKPLIDECLSPQLAHIARNRGYHHATHISWIGKASWKDWKLKQFLLDEDWVLVTRNSTDFRGPKAAPGTRGQFADVNFHPGLICINGPVWMKLPLQIELFTQALDVLDSNGELTNEVLEVTNPESPGPAKIERYFLPKL